VRRGHDSHSTVIELLQADLIVGEIDTDRPAVPGTLRHLSHGLDRYVLHSEIGRGTFGIVFAARDTRLERDVAIKVLHPELATHPEISARFVREARSMARLHHPGIVTILDWGEYEGGAYIVMDRLVGESLAAHMARVGRPLLHDTLEIMRQVTEALQAAHDNGVYHRDLKPENIFLVADESMPGGVRVKLLDFGLAKELGSRFRTGMLSLFGTPQFMSPEQCRCSSSVDHRTDIYSLGIVLFELVTGMLPFDGPLDELIALHQYTPPPRASAVGRCPALLDALIGRMLAKDPSERPQSALEVREQLELLSLPRLGSSDGMSWPEPVHEYTVQRRPDCDVPESRAAFAFMAMTPAQSAGSTATMASARASWMLFVPIAAVCIAFGIFAGALLAG
jgi:serine/threonine protein kinase